MTLPVALDVLLDDSEKQLISVTIFHLKRLRPQDSSDSRVQSLTLTLVMVSLWLL